MTTNPIIYAFAFIFFILNYVFVVVRLDRNWASLESAGKMTTRRQKDAIVYLTGPGQIYRPERTQCPSLLHSIRSLGRHVPRDNSSDLSLIILSDLALDNKTKEEIRNASLFPVDFQENVNLIHTDLEVNVTKDLYYKRMCAFWFYFFFQLPFLPDYVMRMDTDSCLTSDMPSNPFHTMREHHMEYMWYSTFHEPSDVIEELRDHVKQHPGPTRNVDHDHDVDLLWEEKPTNANMRVFSTNIEWMYVPAFRRPEVLAWMESVLKDGGVYDHRWGDAPLRSILATRLFNKSAVGRFCNFSYGHSVWEPFLPCDPAEDIHSPPGRKGVLKFDNGTTIDSTFGWEQVG